MDDVDQAPIDSNSLLIAGGLVVAAAGIYLLTKKPTSGGPPGGSGLPYITSIVPNPVIEISGQVTPMPVIFGGNFETVNTVSFVYPNGTPIQVLGSQSLTTILIPVELLTLPAGLNQYAVKITVSTSRGSSNQYALTIKRG